MKVKVTAIALALMATAVVTAADWPQWQGPGRDSKSPETGLLQQWPQDGPPLAWKSENLGGGDSAPAVVDGRIIAMANRGEDEIVWALSEKDGKELWATRIGPAFQQRPSQGKEGPGCTPTVDGDRLYVEGLAGNVACLQAEDGKIIWQISMTEKFGSSPPMWSYRESPLIDGDTVIVTPGGPDAIMVALDKQTGETLWQTKVPDQPVSASNVSAGGQRVFGRQRSGRGGRGDLGGRGRRGGFGRSRGAGAAYSSPIAIDFNNQRQYVQLISNALIGVAASDGKFLWRYDKPANRMGINCSTAVYHDGMVFASSAYGAGGGLVKLSTAEDGSIKAEEIYATTEMQNHHGGMVLIDGCLYGASGGNEGGALACIDFQTGKVLWDQRQAGQRRAKGSLAFADDRLYYRMEDGTVVLIEPSSKEYVERGRFEQPDRRRQPAWAHPVIANGKLYIRDQDILFCYDVKQK